MLNSINKNILDKIDNLNDIFIDAHNIRSNGSSISRKTSEEIKIENNKDNNGINVLVKPNTKKKNIHVPVILSNENMTDIVYNTFDIGANSDVIILSGCGLHNSGKRRAQHNGNHNFIIHKGSCVKYIEKHYGQGLRESEKVINTKTFIEVEENGQFEMELYQIGGLDINDMNTEIVLHKNAHLIITERISTEFSQKIDSHINVKLLGENSTAQIISRSVAKDNSKQTFYFNMTGENMCRGHIECDSIIMNKARVTSVPALSAYNEDAQLIHEAAIGKIASEQLIKLMSLGLTEKEAQDTILQGFLK